MNGLRTEVTKEFLWSAVDRAQQASALRHISPFDQEIFAQNYSRTREDWKAGVNGVVPVRRISGSFIEGLEFTTKSGVSLIGLLSCGYSIHIQGNVRRVLFSWYPITFSPVIMQIGPTRLSWCVWLNLCWNWIFCVGLELGSKKEKPAIVLCWTYETWCISQADKWLWRMASVLRSIWSWCWCCLTIWFRNWRVGLPFHSCILLYFDCLKYYIVHRQVFVYSLQYALSGMENLVLGTISKTFWSMSLKRLDLNLFHRRPCKRQVSSVQLLVWTSRSQILKKWNIICSIEGTELLR